MPYVKGQSGNPAGRRPGIVSSKRALLEQIIDERGESIVRKTVARAEKGDPVALKLVFDRLPIRKVRPAFELPKIESVADGPIAMGAILSAAADGTLSAADAHHLAGLVEANMTAIREAERCTGGADSAQTLHIEFVGPEGSPEEGTGPESPNAPQAPESDPASDTP